MKIIAIDFDGTIAKVDVMDGKPLRIVEPIEGAVETIRELYNSGEYQLILWTCRADIYEQNELFLTEAINWLRKMDIYDCFYGFNTQPILWKQHETWGRVYSRKVYADIYIDDKNFGGFPGWAEISKQLL